MNIGDKNIKDLTTKEILESLKEEIKSVFEKYKYAELTQEEKELIIEQTTIKVKKTYNEKNEIKDFYIEELEKEIKSTIDQLLIGQKREIPVLAKHIENILSNSKSKDSLTVIKNLTTLLNKYSFVIEPESFLELLGNSEYLEQELDEFVNKYKINITNGNIEELLKNNKAQEIIETYCMLKDIDTNLELEEEKQENPTSENVEDDIKIYLKEIGKIKLLTEEEEKNLAYRIREGDKEARKILANSNLRLVVNIAKRYVGRGVEFLDLIQDGNMGLMKAIEKYDVTKGFRFTTYATWWIKQSITRGIADKSRNVRLPVHLHEKVNKVKLAYNTLSNELGRAPTEEEMAEKTKFPLEVVKELLQYQQGTVSLQTVIGEDDDSELGDFIQSDDLSPEEEYEKLSLSDEIQKAFEKAKLSPREIKVITLRVGLNDNRARTLEEVGKELKVTRERVRQIEAKVLRKLRNPRIARQLRIYNEDGDISFNTVQDLKEKSKIQPEEKQEQDIKKEPEEKIPTIYDTLRRYSKERIDIVLNLLPVEDIKLLEKIYGPDLNNPIKKKPTQQEQDEFYMVLIPEIKKKIQVIEDMKKQEEQKEQNRKSKIIEIESYELREVFENKIKKSDYLRLLDIIKKTGLYNIVSQLTIKETIIISLSFSEISGRYFNEKDIAEFLGITYDEVSKTITKVLRTYPDEINNYLIELKRNLSDEDDTKKYFVKK